MKVPQSLFQDSHGTHDKVIPQWLTERFSGPSPSAPRIFGSRAGTWLQGKGSQKNPSILGSTQGPSSQLPNIRSIRSPIVSYIVPPSRRTTPRPSNSVYYENDRTSSPFLYDLLETEKEKSTSVKNVENTIVEVKILKNNRAGGPKRVCASHTLNVGTSTLVNVCVSLNLESQTLTLVNVAFSTEP